MNIASIYANFFVFLYICKVQIITTSKTGGLLRPYKGLTPVVAL